MLPKINARCCLLTIIYISPVLILFPSVASAQQNVPTPLPDLKKRPIKLSFKKQRFADTIATLSTSLGLNIVVDDEPLPQQVTLDIDGSAEDALDQVSEAFDYSWKQKPNGIIVMVKRFRFAAEHPQYNLPELRRMGHDMVGIFKAIPNAIPVDPEDNFTARTNTFFGLLNPPQVEALRAGKMLLGSDLNANQAEALQMAILRNMFFDQITPWQELMVELDGLERSSFQVTASSAAYLQLYFKVKTTDGTPFSKFIAAMKVDFSSTETKKP